jgi:DNA repair protein SbcD/Mre11
MKILHTADLHIDSPMGSLDRYEGAPVDIMRAATRRAVEAMVELAIRERVAAVTIGGDVFDGAWRDMNTGLWWNARLAELVDAGIEVYVVHGNHDAESLITQRLAPPPGVHVFGANAPSSVTSPRWPLVVHGQSFRDRAVSTDLAAGYPLAVPGLLNVGLLHTSLDGRAGHDPYAPTNVATLLAKGYALWGLGHVHERETIERDGTFVVFPGNTQGRSIRETGARGVTLIATDERRVLSVTPIDVDVIRWVKLGVDVTGMANEDDFLRGAFEAIRAARHAAGRPLAVRVEAIGAGPLHRLLADRAEVVRGELISRASRERSDVWLEKLVVKTRPERVVADADVAAVREVVALAEEAMGDEAVAREIAKVLDPLRDALRPLGIRDPEWAGGEGLRERLRRAADLLIHRLEAR